MEGASAAVTEPAENSTIAAAKSGRRPCASESFP